MLNSIYGIYWKYEIDQFLVNKVKEFSQKQNDNLFVRINLTLGVNKTKCLFKQHLNTNTFIFGTVYHKDTFRPIDEKKDLEILASSSYSDIIKSFWGDYIIIQIKEDNSEFNIFRSPTGQAAIFYLEDKNKVIFSSEIFIIHNFLGKIEFNTAYLLAFLQNYPMHFFTDTAFKNIQELSNGSQLYLNQGMTVSKIFLIWNPLDFIDQKTNENIAQTLVSVTKCYMSNLDNIFLEFSGGLDSTAVLLCAKHNLQHHQKLKAINLFHPAINAANELKYARQITQNLDIELLEVDLSRALPFSPLNQNFVPVNKPNIFAIVNKAIDMYMYQSIGVANLTIFTGEGGDHLFMAPPSIGSLIDLLLIKNFTLCKSKILEIASQFRISFWQIVRYMFYDIFQYLVHKSILDFAMMRSNSTILNNFITPEVIISNNKKFGRQFIQSPFYNLKNSMPGKIDQLDNLYNILYSNSGVRNRFINYQFPILSQVLIEKVLNLPSYDLYDKGYDRLPFRESINKYFNIDLVYRKDKGSTSGVVQLGLMANRDYVINRCTTGYCANNYFIDINLFLKSMAIGIQNGDELHIRQVQTLFALEEFLYSHSRFAV